LKTAHQNRSILRNEREDRAFHQHTQRRMGLYASLLFK